jgi:diadenosine tetraphosphatase ApaH/serine/threonine PP2A family protein phosphatase
MRVALLSDIHANLAALDAVLVAIDALSAVDEVWQLGDIVGYGPDPDGVVARLASLGATGVRGNHDAAALGGSEIDWFNPDARRAMEWTRDAISDRTRAWLAALPERSTKGEFSLVHGSPLDPVWEYITSKQVAAANLEELDRRGAGHGLHGHTHVPALWRRQDGRVTLASPRAGDALPLGEGPTLLNPGSVGQPRDGDPRAAFAILDTAAGTCEWHRVVYDIRAVQAAMTRVRLPEWLISRLSVGQ